MGTSQGRRGQHRAVTSAPRHDTRLLMARNMILLREGWRAVCALEDAGIPAIALKGAALIDVVYAIDERAMADFDVLVPRHAYRQAEAAMTRAGFRPATTDRPLDRLTRHSRPFTGQRGCVDLHTELAYPWRWPLDYDALFRRAVPLSGPDGRRGRRLANEDLLITNALAEANDELCADGRRIEDIRRITDSLPIDWSALCARARQGGCQVALWLTLQHARASAGAPIPDHVLAELAPAAPRRLYLGALIAADGKPAYRFPNHPRLVRQALAGPALTDAPWRFAAMIGRRGAIRAADILTTKLRDKSSRGSAARMENRHPLH